jgi:hypothetical protein
VRNDLKQTRPTAALPAQPKPPQPPPPRPPPLKARFIEEVGVSASLRIYWHSDIPCQGWSYHNAENEIKRSSIVGERDFAGEVKDYWGSPLWAKVCDHCGTPVPDAKDANLSYQVFYRRLYNTPSGKPEPGDIFFRDVLCKTYGCHYWDNCPGLHLHAILPNGTEWDIDSQANNCTKPNDRLHRCWVRHGDPTKGELVHVDKAGLTCQAGGGSIISGNYHGFLHNGIFTSC